MNLPVSLSLAEASFLPTEKVGGLARKLIELELASVPVASTVIIPPAALQRLVIHDESVTQQLIKLYHQRFNNDFVTLYYQAQGVEVTVPNILGDTNLITTLQECATSNHHQLILIQASPQPELSGIGLTTNVSGKNKRQLEIAVAKGVYHPEFAKHASHYVVDLRTKQVVHRHLVSPTIAWKRGIDRLEQYHVAEPQPVALSSEQLEKLIEILIQTKRSFFSNQEIAWFVHQGKLSVSMVQAMESDHHNSEYTLIGVGTSLVSGYVQGTSFIPNSNHTTAQISGSILIAKQLDKKHLPLLKQVAAVVVEQSITDQQVLRQLTQFHLPAIINSHFITHNIQPNQEIIVDATHGKIYRHSQSFSNRSSLSQTEIALYTGNPEAVTSSIRNNINSLFFSSNYIYALLGKHPLQLIKADRNQFASAQQDALLIAQLLSDHHWFYLPFSMTSKDRQLLKYSSAPEKDETNPSLGLRGTELFLSQPQILIEELASLYHLTTTLKANLRTNIVLPFIKNHTDGALATRIISHQFPNPPWKMWYHLVTLASVQEIKQHHTTVPSGYIIDLDYLLSSWQGSDPTQAHHLMNRAHQVESFWQLLHQHLDQTHQLYFFSRYLTRDVYNLVQTYQPRGLITTQQHLSAVL